MVEINILSIKEVEINTLVYTWKEKITYSLSRGEKIKLSITLGGGGGNGQAKTKIKKTARQKLQLTPAPDI